MMRNQLLYPCVTVRVRADLPAFRTKAFALHRFAVPHGGGQCAWLSVIRMHLDGIAGSVCS